MASINPCKRIRSSSMAVTFNACKRGRIGMAMASSEYSDWAGLPNNVLDSILEKLVLLADYVRFGAVCVGWRDASLHVSNQKRRIEFQLAASHHRRVPLLLFPPPPPTTSEEESEPPTTTSEEEREEDTSREEKWQRSLYSVIQRKVLCDFNLPAPNSNRRCCGSSHGWLITADDTLSLTLFNPFYIGGGGQCRGIIRLPPIDCGSINEIREESGAGAQYMVDLTICKAVLSADPAVAPDDYVVMVIYGFFQNLAFIKSGDKNWTKLDTRPTFFIHFDDVIYHKGLVYATTGYTTTDAGGLFSCDIANPGPKLRKVISPPRPPHNYIYARHYIVESPQGDLLLVYRDLQYLGDPDDSNDPRPLFFTTRFSVFKLLVLDQLTTWVEMKSLGDNALFLGDNHSTCISASHLTGCQPNSIYFTDDNLASYASEPASPRIPSDMDVFNLEDQSFQPHYEPDSDSSLVTIPPPVWFLPSIPGKWP